MVKDHIDWQPRQLAFIITYLQQAENHVVEGIILENWLRFVCKVSQQDPESTRKPSVELDQGTAALLRDLKEATNPYCYAQRIA